IEPQTFARHCTDSLPGGNELQHEIRKIEISARRNEFQHGGFIDIDAHAHVIAVLRFFFVSDYAIIVSAFQDSQVDLYVPAMGGNSESGALAAMKGYKRVEVEIGEHVTVHDKESVIEIRYRCKRARGTGGLVLFYIAQPNLGGESVMGMK